MSVSLIVITRETGARLACCLAATAAHRPAADERILVVDAEQVPAALDALASGWRLVCGGGRGRAAARNAGAGAATGDVLAFLDGDVLTAPDWLQRLKAALTAGILGRGRIRDLLGAAPCRDFAAGGPGFPPLAPQALAQAGFAPVGYRLGISLLEQAVEARFVAGEAALPPWLAAAGANFMVRRSTWADLGGQDERFGRDWGCEDLEFAYRAAKVGPIAFAADAVGYHLAHVQPGRWGAHARTHELFLDLHPGPAVAALPCLLAPDGSLQRYRAALAADGVSGVGR